MSLLIGRKVEVDKGNGSTFTGTIVDKVKLNYIASEHNSNESVTTDHYAIIDYNGNVIFVECCCVFKVL